MPRYIQLAIHIIHTYITVVKRKANNIFIARVQSAMRNAMPQNYVNLSQIGY